MIERQQEELAAICACGHRHGEHGIAGEAGNLTPCSRCDCERFRGQQDGEQ